MKKIWSGDQVDNDFPEGGEEMEVCFNQVASKSFSAEVTLKEAAIEIQGKAREMLRT